MDVSKMRGLGYSPSITLEQGIERTIQEYMKLKKGRKDLMIPLMKNAFINEYETKKQLAEFILKTERLSMDQKCFEFEREFCQIPRSKTFHIV